MVLVAFAMRTAHPLSCSLGRRRCECLFWGTSIRGFWLKPGKNPPDHALKRHGLRRVSSVIRLDTLVKEDPMYALLLALFRRSLLDACQRPVSFSRFRQHEFDPPGRSRFKI